MSIQAPPHSPYDLFKPFVWLALLAFLLGFSSFLLAGASNVAQAHDRAQAILPAADSAPGHWGAVRPI
ncbi:hypothetical protein [Phenylobacterium aquaticum]|uniref:hypothetical protein n=1 Tax=Phenylobacterium aquaticum TaxID=1763816 RepID=UPI0026F2F0E1|nr:hypothetical protein [Phenylobacterium aquaticum]